MTLKDGTDALLRLLGLFLSWPVLAAAVLIVYRKFFRAQLPQLFDRLKSIGKDGLEFTEPRTAATSLGATRVSNAVAPFPEDHFVYHSNAYQCEISYPRRGSWDVAFDRAGAGQAGPMIIFSIRSGVPLQLADGNKFDPNINVLIEPLGVPMGDRPILTYMGLSLKACMQVIQGFSLKAYEVDESTNSAMVNYTGTFNGESLSWFQRVTIARGLAHCITMTTPEVTPTTAQLPESLKKTLNAILNSFHVVEAPAAGAGQPD